MRGRGAGRFVVAAAVAALAEVASVALVATAVWLVVTAGQRPGIAALSLAIVAVRALAVGAGVLRYAERLVGHDAVLAGLVRRRVRVVDALVPRSARLGRGRWTRRLVSDVDSVGDLTVRGVLPAVAVGTTGSLTVAGAAVLAPPAALALAGGLLAVAGLTVLALRCARGPSELLGAQRETLAAAALELARAGPDLAVFGGLDAAERAARDVAERASGAERAAARVQAGLRAAAGLLAAAATVAVLVAAAHLGPAPAAVLPVLTGSVLAGACALLGAAPRLADALAARRRLDGLHRSPLPVPDPAHPLPLPPRPPGDAPHLRLPGLDLPPGSRTLLTGPSGSGKSTLLQALWRVTDAAGHTIDGVDARDLHGDAVREVVGGLWQDAHLPRATLRDALRLARPDATDTDLHAALATAGLPADALAPGGPDPLDRVVAEGGENLSGGQRRRLLVARTLLARHPVLLFDEPAEGLPPAEADALLHRLLTLGPPGRTVVVVTHRVPDPVPPGAAVHRVAGLGRTAPVRPALPPACRSPRPTR